YYLSLATVESDTEGKPTEDTTNVLNVDRNLNFPVAFVPISEKLAEEKRVQQKPTPKEAKRIYKKFHKLIDKIVRRVSERKPISQSDAKRLKRLINSISKLREHNYSGIDFY
ncbi:unnamed protein product, partial [Callosobruchus maculatus]